MNVSLARKVSGWLPIAMSVAALGVLLCHLTMVGTAPEPDEGTTAHVWQLLMVAQVPVVAFFALKWLRRSPREALPVLAIQAAAALAAMAPVYFLGL